MQVVEGDVGGLVRVLALASSRTPGCGASTLTSTTGVSPITSSTVGSSTSRNTSGAGRERGRPRIRPAPIDPAQLDRIQ
jgi:hypothetical protein